MLSALGHGGQREITFPIIVAFSQTPFNEYSIFVPSSGERI